MSYKQFLSNIFFAVVIGFAASCNTRHQQPTNNSIQTSAAIDSMLKANDTALMRDHYAREKIKSLLSHFPDDKNFPVIIDSTYMANVAKGHDSLGTNEVKTLVRFFYTDDLTNSDSSELYNFYKIDSIKKNHAMEKWMENHPEGAPTQMNAYALKKIWMREQTLLVWALVVSQQYADPVYQYTTVYYTILNNNTILTTFKMGEISNGMDPPMGWESALTGKLNEDGKLLMDKNSTDFDIDSDTAETNHIHYEYLIHQGSTKLLSKKEDEPKKLIIKSEN
jgi:hypothetical protein